MDFHIPCAKCERSAVLWVKLRSEPEGTWLCDEHGREIEQSEHRLHRQVENDQCSSS